MITLIIYILFSYLFSTGIIMSEYYKHDEYFYISWEEIVTFMIAPVSFPVILGVYMNQKS